MLMSMVITSGFRASACDTASRPSRASPTTSKPRSASKMLCSTLRINAESSTISTRSLLEALIVSEHPRRSMLHLYRHSTGRTDQTCHRCDELLVLDRLGQKGCGPFLDRTLTM